jgi:hypothetical protein
LKYLAKVLIVNILDLTPKFAWAGEGGLPTMYDVKVKLIKEAETCKSFANGFNAGKYIWPDTGEKNPAQEAIKTINLFWFFVKTEWIGPPAEALVAVRCI